MTEARYYKPGDLIGLGEGITWKLSEALATSLNRDLCRRDRGHRRRKMLP